MHFLPVSSHETGLDYHDQTILGESPIDVSTGSQFFGLSTYANLPYVNCLSSQKDVVRYDIAILGAPFDTVYQVLHSKRKS